MKAAALVSGHAPECGCGIMREKQASSTIQKLPEERALLVDQHLGVAVVAHRDGYVHPRRPGDCIRREDDRAVLRCELGQEETGGMPIREVIANARGRNGRAAPRDELEPAAVHEQLR